VTGTAGYAGHIEPNVGHRARNDGTTVTKLVVMRIKDKTKPIIAPFDR
jgi:hypothetical protein